MPIKKKIILATTLLFISTFLTLGWKGLEGVYYNYSQKSGPFGPGLVLAAAFDPPPHEDAGHEEEESQLQQLNRETGIYSPLPWCLILIPLIGAISLFGLRHEYLQSLMVIFTPGLGLAMCVLMYPQVIQGQKGGEVLRRGLYYSLNFLPSFNLNLSFKVDPVALLLVIFTCLVWVLTAIFSYNYLAIENNRLRYKVANLCCLSATLGAFSAGDFFTFYIFYECILIFLYLMVIHRQDRESLEAAKVYLYFGVFTGLLLLFGIFLFSYFAGTIEMQSAATAFSRVHPGFKYLVAGLFLVGFGGKAGVFLEHIWMPSSYMAAPCVTAALSSGIMIEVGAYGIFRTVNMIFAPSVGLSEPQGWLTSSNLGYILILVGIITMFLGAVNALFSQHALRLLAYSSVSQMGYIIMGIGCAAYMGGEGAMGLAGAIYHIINHALFKAGLFLSIGAVYFRTKELDIRKLGGLWSSLPVAALAFLISALAISGFPLFNGFASKTMLHHALLEAYQYSVQLSPTHQPDIWLRISEIFFMITAGGTFAYNMKLFALTFLGPSNKELGKINPTPMVMNVSLMLFSTVILLIGLFPNWLLENLIGPALPYFGFNPHSHAYHLIYNPKAISWHSILPLLYDPVKKSVFGSIFGSVEVIHNLSGSSSALFIGGIILLAGFSLGWFERILPSGLSLERYYQQLFNAFIWLCRIVYCKLVKGGEKIIGVLMVYLWIPKIKLDLIIPHQVSNPGEASLNWSGPDPAQQPCNPVRYRPCFFDHISLVDQKYDLTLARAGNIKQLFGRISSVDERLSASFDNALGVNRTEKGFFNRLTRADLHLDGVFDKVIFSRFFWGVVTKARSSGFKTGIWKYFNILERGYDKFIDHLLFSILGSEDLSKIRLQPADFANSWFLRMCKKASEIHTGDISQYISWVALTMTAIIGMLVGFLYIDTFFTLIITLTVLILFFGLLAFFFKL